MSPLCRTLLVCTALSITHFAFGDTNADIATFKQSWTATALTLQREIDINAPLTEATFIGTHNSYNAKSYEIPFIRYIDPNQLLSIYDQLEQGIRSIELDTHWTFTQYASHDILLCHGKANHLGCSPFDRPLNEGLIELRDWLKAHPHEIVLLYLERFLDGHEPRLAALLEEYLGEFIFKTATVKLNNHSHDCVSLPGSLSKAEILRAGKQLLIVTKGCAAPNEHYEEQNIYPQNINDFVFAGIGNIPTHPSTFIDDTIDHFTAYPDCGKSTIFSSDYLHTSLWRIYEDRTFISNISYRHKPLEIEEMQTLMHCGTNWPAMDKLTVGDPRLTTAIWSWAPSFPRADEGECSIYKSGEGIENKTCDKLITGYACKEENTHHIKAINLLGNWITGESACQLLAGKNWHFSVPVNGQQMTALKESMNTLALSDVWLNYSLNKQGHWIANA